MRRIFPKRRCYATRLTTSQADYIIPPRRQRYAMADNCCIDACVDSCVPMPTCVAPPTCAVPPVCAAPRYTAPMCAAPATCVVPPSCVAPPTCAVPQACVPDVCIPDECAPSCVAPSCVAPASCVVPMNYHTQARHVAPRSLFTRLNAVAQTPTYPQASFPVSRTQVASSTKLPTSSPSFKHPNDAIETLYSKGMTQQADGSWVPTGSMPSQSRSINEPIPAYTPDQERTKILLPEPEPHSSRPRVNPTAQKTSTTKTIAYRKNLNIGEQTAMNPARFPQAR